MAWCVWPETQEQVNLELILLHRLFDHHRPLLEKASKTEPDRTELVALAGIVHSFYTGVENVFKQIAKDIDGSIPSGMASHVGLLSQTAQATDARPAVISEELRLRLRDYMDLRHVYRHAYTFDLKWRRMADLVLHCEETLDRLERELGAFFS